MDLIISGDRLTEPARNNRARMYSDNFPVSSKKEHPPADKVRPDRRDPRKRIRLTADLAASFRMTNRDKGLPSRLTKPGV